MQPLPGRLCLCRRRRASGVRLTNDAHEWRQLRGRIDNLRKEVGKIQKGVAERKKASSQLPAAGGEQGGRVNSTRSATGERMPAHPAF